MGKLTETEKAKLEKEIICRACISSADPERFKNSKSPIPNKRKDPKGYNDVVKEFRKIHNHSMCFVRTLKPEYTERDLERHKGIVEQQKHYDQQKNRPANVIVEQTQDQS